MITRARDEADERDFWSKIQAEHALLSPAERAAYETNKAGKDDLADPGGQIVGEEDAW